jgi:hypothetical protein
LAKALELNGADFDRWDIAMIGAGVIVCDERGATMAITNPDPALWRAHAS